MKLDVEKMYHIYDVLGDEKSKRTFAAKLNFLISRNESVFLDWMLAENSIFYIPDLDKYEKETGFKGEYIIFGGGEEGKKTLSILQASKRCVSAICDNNKELWGTNINSVPIISAVELVKKYKDETVIITPLEGKIEIYRQLLRMNFPRTKIVIPTGRTLLAHTGRQYFDMFEAEKNETFIDAGCWDGSTSVEFTKWCKNMYTKIYAFEPDKTCWEKCNCTFERENIKNVEFIKMGTWDSTRELYFEGVGIGSSQVNEQNVLDDEIMVTSIDEVLNGREVTFIKLDVEGSELKTLMGAKKSIMKYKPKLAVSVYHRPEDLWVLADYILGLNPEYKLYMRHYTTRNVETILYAI